MISCNYWLDNQCFQKCLMRMKSEFLSANMLEEKHKVVKQSLILKIFKFILTEIKGMALFADDS